MNETPQPTGPGHTPLPGPAASSPAAPTSFKGLVPRPVGSRYGDSDLLPVGINPPTRGGGGGEGGMYLGPEAFQPPGQPPSFNGHIRFDPIFPGHAPPFFHPGPPGAHPGEPDPDHLCPLQGGPGGPFGGPGGGQFGPRFPSHHPRNSGGGGFA